jgi:chromosome segregation ATPase
MKSFLQNLLIFFALALCGLMIYQWVRETELRKKVQALTDTVHDKSEAIQNLQGNVKRDEAEIQRLDGLKTQLTQTVKSNEVRIAGLGKDLEKTTNELDHAQKQIVVYKDAVDRANDSIKTQNDTIKSQNDEMKKMAEDRNAMVQKFNKMAADYNDLAKKWNEQQELLAKQATNPPAKK